MSEHKIIFFMKTMRSTKMQKCASHSTTIQIFKAQLDIFKAQNPITEAQTRFYFLEAQSNVILLSLASGYTEFIKLYCAFELRPLVVKLCNRLRLLI